MIGLLLSLLAIGTMPAGDARVERTLVLMGTEARIAVSAVDRAAALAASEAAVAALAATEARLSTWRDDSELERLNRAAPDELLSVSPWLAADLAAARWCWQETGGAFDPTVGALAEAWGLRHGGRLPSADEIAEARQATGMDRLRIQGSQVRRPDGLRIEEGGFGKGVGLAAATRALADDPRVLEAAIDLGGQLALLGAGSSWTAAVAAPGERSRPVLEITLDGGSLATSGNSERGIEVDGRRRSHLIDPRSGYPAEDFGSLTVWTADPLRADCLSTGLYVLGPDAALAWAAEHPDYEALVLAEKKDGRLLARVTPGLRERIRPLAEGVEIATFSPPAVASQEGSRAGLK